MSDYRPLLLNKWGESTSIKTIFPAVDVKPGSTGDANANWKSGASGDSLVHSDEQGNRDQNDPVNRIKVRNKLLFLLYFI